VTNPTRFLISTSTAQTYFSDEVAKWEQVADPGGRPHQPGVDWSAPRKREVKKDWRAALLHDSGGLGSEKPVSNKNSWTVALPTQN